MLLICSPNTSVGPFCFVLCGLRRLKRLLLVLSGDDVDWLCSMISSTVAVAEWCISILAVVVSDCVAKCTSWDFTGWKLSLKWSNFHPQTPKLESLSTAYKQYRRKALFNSFHLNGYALRSIHRLKS